MVFYTGKVLVTEEVRALGVARLALTDDSGTQGITIEDGGQVGVNTSTPSQQLDVNGSLALTGNHTRYIVGDTKDGSDNSALYVMGAPSLP